MRSLQFFLGLTLALLLALSAAGSNMAGKAPLYLGMNQSPQTISLGASVYTFPKLPEEARPLLMRNASGFRFTPDPGNFLEMDTLNVSEYHTPTIVEFLEDGRPMGINYSYHVPALGDFASPNWSPTRDIQFYHVPAITNFLKIDWQPPEPEFNEYPTWISQFLRD
jgi:hypothetical protein